MFNGSNCDRKSQLSGILTELLNSRGVEDKTVLKPILLQVSSGRVEDKTVLKPFLLQVSSGRVEDKTVLKPLLL